MLNQTMVNDGGGFRQALRDAATKKVVHESDGVRFDVDVMSKARDYIFSSYEILSSSLKTINEEKFPTYIDESSGLFIKVPTLSKALKDVWDDNVVVQLNDFLAQYSEWSGVMGMSQAAATELTNEAVAAYTSQAKDGVGKALSEYTGIKVDELVLPLDSAGREAIRTAIAGYKESSEGWSERVAQMTESEKHYLMQELEGKVPGDYWNYRAAVKDPDKLAAFRASIPPEELELIERQYRRDTGVE